MAIKLKINEEEYNALGEAIKELYTETDEGYALSVDGVEDTGALKRAKDHEKKQRQAAENAARELREQVKALEEQFAELKDNGARKSGDIEALEKSYQQKLQKLAEEADTTRAKLQSVIERQTVDSTATKLATTLCGDNADIIMPHIKSRLRVEIDDGNAQVRVLDDTGQVTADSIDDLQKYFFTSERFAPIIVGSKASGGGVAGRKLGGGATKQKLSEMTATEEALFAKENPVEYKQMLESVGKP